MILWRTEASAHGSEKPTKPGGSCERSTDIKVLRTGIKIEGVKGPSPVSLSDQKLRGKNEILMNAV